MLRFLIPNSVIAKETNTDLSSKKLIPKDIEEYQARSIIELMDKYNAIAGTTQILDNKGNVIYTFETITRDIK